MNKKILIILIAVIIIGVVIAIALTSSTNQEVEIGGLNFNIPEEYIISSGIPGSEDMRIIFVPEDGQFSFIIAVDSDNYLTEFRQTIVKNGTNKTINGINGIYYTAISEDGSIEGNHYFYFKYQGKNVQYMVSKFYSGDPIEFFSQIKIK